MNPCLLCGSPHHTFASACPACAVRLLAQQVRHTKTAGPEAAAILREIEATHGRELADRIKQQAKGQA